MARYRGDGLGLHSPAVGPVVVPSLESGQTQNLSLFTQYNPHGFFIAFEVLGYLTMSGALLFAAAAYPGGGVERGIRALFILGFGAAILAFVALWLVRRDLVAVEVAVLSVNWVVLIVSGVLLAVVFRRTALS